MHMCEVLTSISKIRTVSNRHIGTKRPPTWAYIAQQSCTLLFKTKSYIFNDRKYISNIIIFFFTNINHYPEMIMHPYYFSSFCHQVLGRHSRVLYNTVIYLDILSLNEGEYSQESYSLISIPFSFFTTHITWMPFHNPVKVLKCFS